MIYYRYILRLGCGSGWTNVIFVYNDGVPDECVLLAGLDHVPEEDLGGEGVAVVDDRLPVLPVPAVQLHAPAAQLGERELYVQEVLPHFI